MTLIERLAERARNPQTIKDDGPEVAGGRGKGVVWTPPAPASEEQIRAAEAQLGHTLPPLLRQLYREIGDGGFGPGGGFRTLASLGAAEPSGSQPLPRSLLRICDWGSGIASLMDCTIADAPVIRMDPNMPKREEAERVPVARRYARAAQVAKSCWVESPTLEAWLEAWADGKKLFYLGYGEPEASEEDADDDLDDDE